MEYNDLTGTIPYDIDQLQKLGTFAFWKSVYRTTHSFGLLSQRIAHQRHNILLDPYRGSLLGQ